MKCLPLKPESQSLQPIVGPDAANNLDFDLLAMYIVYLWRMAVQKWLGACTVNFGVPGFRPRSDVRPLHCM